MKIPSDALGMLVVAFQDVEKALVEVLTILMKECDYRIVMIFASQMPFRKLVHCVSAVIEIKYPHEHFLAKMQETLKRCFSLDGDRNKFVHSFYDIDTFCDSGITYHRTKYTVKGKLSSQSESIDMDGGKIRDVISSAQQIAKELEAFTEELFLKTASQEEIQDYYSCK